MIKAQDFIILYESYRDFKTEQSLFGGELNEKGKTIKVDGKTKWVGADGRLYNSPGSWARDNDPELYNSKYKAKYTANNKKELDKKLAKKSDESKKSYYDRRMQVAIMDILKKQGIINKTYNYDEYKQVAGLSFDDLLKDHPEAAQQIYNLIQTHPLGPDAGVQILNTIFVTNTDAKNRNATYSRNRQEHREPDDPFDQQIKASKKASIEKDMDIAIEQLKNMQIDSNSDKAEFITTLMDAIKDFNLLRFRPKLKKLQSELTEDDPKLPYINKAIEQSLKVKHRNLGLED